jgi:hypothetical protein
VKPRAILALTAAALITAACGGSSESEPSGSAAQSTVDPTQMQDQQAPPDRLVVDIAIKGGKATPVNEQLQATLGQPIVLRVDSDATDELHVHSNPEHTFQVEPKPGQSFQFTVDVPGKVDVELHDLGSTLATISVR